MSASISTTASISRPTTPNRAPAAHAAHALDWLMFGRGPGTTPGALAMAFVRSGPDAPDPDLQLHFTPVGYKLTPDALIVLDEPVVTAIPNVNRPASRGEMTIAGPDMRLPPVIQPRLLEHSRDVEVLRRGGAHPARHFQRPRRCASMSLRSSRRDPRSRPTPNGRAICARDSVTIFHPCGTCRMGIDAMRGGRPALCACAGLKPPCRRRLDHAASR